jgi:MFS family permease
MTPDRVRRTYLLLTLGTTLAASFIWGINTLFLLDAGLTNLEAFAANAFFTVGMVAFEIPTGVVADTWGRRASFLLGTGVLAASTLAYVAMWWVSAPFWAWALASVAIGLGFTFFSGATEAWLVDALHATGFTGPLERVFGQAQVVAGAAMLVGSVGGGLVAQVWGLGTPYVLRVVALALTGVLAAVAMRDLGFVRAAERSPSQAIRRVLGASWQHGLRQPAVRGLMLSAAFLDGVAIYAFYALQPYLLELYGDQRAYWVAGLAAAVVAGAQMLGGALAGRVRGLVRLRSTVLLASAVAGAGLLGLLALARNVVVAVALVVLWAVAGAVATPVRRAYLNDLVPASERATVLSFDSLFASSGGVVTQPALGRLADASGYGPTFAVSGVIQALAVPFLWASRRSAGAADSGVTREVEPAS